MLGSTAEVFEEKINPEKSCLQPFGLFLGYPYSEFLNL